MQQKPGARSKEINVSEKQEALLLIPNVNFTWNGKNRKQEIQRVDMEICDYTYSIYPLEHK